MAERYSQYPTVISMLRPSKLAGADPEVLGIMGSGITYSMVVWSCVSSVRLAEMSRWQWPGSHSMR